MGQIESGTERSPAALAKQVDAVEQDVWHLRREAEEGQEVVSVRTRRRVVSGSAQLVVHEVLKQSDSLVAPGTRRTHPKLAIDVFDECFVWSTTIAWLCRTSLQWTEDTHCLGGDEHVPGHQRRNAVHHQDQVDHVEAAQTNDTIQSLKTDAHRLLILPARVHWCQLLHRSPEYSSQKQKRSLLMVYSHS